MSVKRFCRDVEFNAVGCYAYAADVLGKRRDRAPAVEKRRGEVAVVTGGARGIGLHVVAHLLECDFTVVVGVRNPSNAEKVLQDLENASNAVVLPLDLDSLKSVKNFAESVLMKFDRVNVLVNNAGVLLVPHALTEDGFERHFGVNYLGHFYLNHLLLPALARGGAATGAPGRVVAVTSTTYLGAKIHFDDINLDKFRCKSEAYGQSKLALIMSSSYLSDLARARNWPVSFFAVDPGIVNTQVFDNTPVKKYLIAADRMLKSPRQGARSILYACLDRHIDPVAGEFITNCGVGRKSKFAVNKDHQYRLFQLSCDMIQVNEEQYGLESDEATVTHL